MNICVWIYKDTLAGNYIGITDLEVFDEEGWACGKEDTWPCFTDSLVSWLKDNYEVL